MDNHPGTLHTVRWNQVCPWLLLVRAVRPALFLRVLLLAWCGVWLTQGGWYEIESHFAEPGSASLARLTDEVGEAAQELPRRVSPSAAEPGLASLRSDVLKASPVVRGWAWAIQPLVRLGLAKSWQEAGVQVLAGIWTIAIWALIGGAIARIAALWLTRRESLGILAALRGSLRAWTTFTGAPAIAFIGLLVMSTPLLLAGLVSRIAVGETAVAATWIIALLCGVVFFIATLGLLLGWPLMWATAAVERTDAFDGISRAYAYVFQRPLHMLFYFVVTSLLGFLAHWLLTILITGGVETATRLVDLGAGHDLELGDKSQIASLWERGLLSLSAVFPMAYLWSAAVGIYLLLRQQIDSTELDQIKLDAPLKAGLPSLVTDPATGVPTVEKPDEPQA